MPDFTAEGRPRYVADQVAVDVDPNDPDAFDEEGPDEVAEYDIEAPQEDAAEQHLELLQHRDEPLTGRELAEADPADAAEQRRVVEQDEDDYR